MSGWRRMTPVEEHGASTRMRSKGRPSQKVAGSRASPTHKRAVLLERRHPPPPGHQAPASTRRCAGLRSDTARHTARRGHNAVARGTGALLDLLGAAARERGGHRGAHRGRAGRAACCATRWPGTGSDRARARGATPAFGCGGNRRLLLCLCRKGNDRELIRPRRERGHRGRSESCRCIHATRPSDKGRFEAKHRARGHLRHCAGGL